MTEITKKHGEDQSGSGRWFATYVGCFAACSLAVAAFLYEPGQDHFGAITLDGNGDWYQNFADYSSMRDIQDRDVFYHDIGRSIEYARNADIILLGHSMVLWGMDWRLLREFARKHGVRLYNLASAGDASGEFLLRVIKKNDIKARLWVINADDYNTNFFSTSLDDLGNFGKRAANVVVTYGRGHAWRNVISRDFRWRLEELIRAIAPEKVNSYLYRKASIVTFRSASDGTWFIEKLPIFVSRDNPMIQNIRIQTCPAQQPEIQQAKRYMDSLGGSFVFMLVPHLNACRQRVGEMARALGISSVLIDESDITSVDGGYHFDAAGARLYTARFLQKLEATPEFQKLVRERFR